MGLFDRFGFRENEEEIVEEEILEEGKDLTVASPSGKAPKQFVLVRPSDPSNDHLLEIADHLLNKETVILNLELIAKDARHYIDFLSGVAYALQGKTKKIATNIFLIAPGGIEISGDISDPELKL